MPRQFACVLAACLLLNCNTINGQQKNQEGQAAAQKAAESWLPLIDAGKYGESWDQAAEVFRSAVTKEKWEQAVGNVRQQTGKLKSRKLTRAEYTEQLPNAPKGEYVLIQYDSSFENVASAVETIVPMREKDGTWKVSGYFVKPKE